MQPTSPGGVAMINWHILHFFVQCNANWRCVAFINLQEIQKTTYPVSRILQAVLCKTKHNLSIYIHYIRYAIASFLG